MKNFIKHTILVLGLLSFFGVNSQRIKQSINTGWDFHRGTLGQTPNDWLTVNIPHSWNTTDLLDETPGYYRGVGWYKKEIYIPKGWKQKSIYIFFEGANQETEVYVNGKSAGNHQGGYTAFSFNITTFLQTGKNEIRVKVDNSHNEDIPPLSADFSYYGGIYRDVYLLAANSTHFNLDNYGTNGIFITTPRVSAKEASVTVNGEVTGCLKNSLVEIQLMDSEGTIVDRKVSGILEDGSFEMLFDPIRNPDLWSPESPNLYRMVASLIDKKSQTEIDRVTESFGFRWFEFDSKKGFYLNGNPLKLIGASRHQDYKELGNALDDEMHVRDMKMLKQMGANFVRVAHYPQDPAILEACDRLGLLAAVETPGNNRITQSEVFTRNSIEMQKEMIRQNFNHPSIIMWGYMNEVLIDSRYKEGSKARADYYADLRTLAMELEKVTREEDPNRYTVIAFHGDYDGYRDVGLIDIPKIAGWNLYYGWYIGQFKGFQEFIDRFHRDYPDLPILITEYGAGSNRSLHDFTPNRFDFTEEYAVDYHRSYLKAIQDRDFISGGVIWNLVDFNNEIREDVVPHMNSKGIMTDDRIPKNAYWFYKANLISEPFIKIASKDWHIRIQQADEGVTNIATQKLRVFSNSPSVKLFLDGKAIGEASTTEGIAEFAIPFHHGKNVLKASSAGVEDVLEVDFQVIPSNLKSKEISFDNLNVSLGDERFYYDAKTSINWIPEQAYKKGSWGFVGGEIYRSFPNDSRYGSFKDILGTDSNAIYETQRYGIESFRADVPNGVYDITFHLAELLSGEKFEHMVYNLNDTGNSPETSGGRDFNVLINDKLIIEHISNNNYLKPLRAYRTKVRVFVDQGAGISIDFEENRGRPVLNAIQIQKIY